MNLALAAIYGADYGSEKQIIRERIPKMQESIAQRVEMEKKEIEAEERAKVAEKEEEERVHDAIMNVVGGIWDMARRRLHDPYGDYIEWWEELARLASEEAGVEIEAADVLAVVKYG